MTRKLLAADDVKEAMVALLRKQFNLKQTAEWERRIAEALDAIPAAEGATGIRSWVLKKMRDAANEGNVEHYVLFTLVLEQVDGKEYIEKDDADLAASNPNP